MRSNGLFEESNEQHIFSKLFCNLNFKFKFPVCNAQWKIIQWKISLYRKYMEITKKGENTMISNVQ